MADLSEYRVLYGIEFSPDVRKLMSLFAECWEECHADDCTTCKYRHGRDHYKLMYCLSERYAEKLIANGVTVRERGYWASLTDCANAGVYAIKRLIKKIMRGATEKISCVLTIAQTAVQRWIWRADNG